MVPAAKMAWKLRAKTYDISINQSTINNQSQSTEWRHQHHNHKPQNAHGLTDCSARLVFGHLGLEQHGHSTWLEQHDGNNTLWWLKIWQNLEAQHHNSRHSRNLQAQNKKNQSSTQSQDFRVSPLEMFLLLKIILLFILASRKVFVVVVVVVLVDDDDDDDDDDDVAVAVACAAVQLLLVVSNHCHSYS